jgi:hypothetical protein
MKLANPVKIVVMLLQKKFGLFCRRAQSFAEWL